MPYHITQRGVDGRETFSCIDDRHTYIGLLRLSLADTGVRLQGLRLIEENRAGRIRLTPIAHLTAAGAGRGPAGLAGVRPAPATAAWTARRERPARESAPHDRAERTTKPALTSATGRA